MSGWQASIESMERRDVRAAGAMLARSFDDSPLFRHLLPSARTRPIALASFFRAATRDAMPFGHVEVARDGSDVIGAAVWLPPGSYPPSPARTVRQLVASWTFAIVAPTSIAASVRYLRANEKVHPKIPHWYLGILGVDPQHQGRGIGGQLLRRVLDPADATGEAAYLETDKERNLAFYNRFRFSLVETLHPDGPTAPPCWTMWREPAP